MAEKLTQLISKINQTRSEADIALEGIEPQFIPGWSIRKNAAKQELPKLEQEYTKELKEHLVYILANGSPEKVAAFSGIANVEAGTFVIGANEFVLEVAQKVNASIGPNREFFMHQIMMMMDLISSKEAEFNLPGTHFGSIPGTAVSYTPTFDDVVKIVYDFIHKNVNPGLLTTLVERRAYRAAIESGFDKEVFPVVVTGLTEVEVEEFKTKHKYTFVVELNTEEVDKNLVFGILKKIKSTLTKKSTKEN